MFIKYIIVLSLLIAIYGVPYIGYYQLLRFIICGYFLYLISIEESNKNLNTGWIIISSFICILFNPIFQFHLGREVWIIADIIVVFILVFIPIEKKSN